jgi:hypothetical protein
MSENKETTNQNEFEINTPHKENEEITTNDHNKNQSNEQVQKEKQNGSQKSNEQVGFETGQKPDDKQGQNVNQNQNDQQKRIDNDKDREERKNPDNAKYQDADWQQDKINEANNEDGNPVDGKGKANQNAEKGVDKEANVSDKDKEKGKFGDTRTDSIIDRPKTETYEKKNK